MMKMRSMRMPYLAELRWLIASKLLAWALDLAEREMSTDALYAFQQLIRLFTPRPEYETVPMRKRPRP